MGTVSLSLIFVIMKLFSLLLFGLIDAKPEDRLATLESKLERLEHLIISLDQGRDGDCNSGGTLEELNTYLCDLSTSAEEFVESTRQNYIDLQLKIEANAATIDGIKDELNELNDQEQILTKQVNNVDDTIDCGVQGEFQPQCKCNGILQNGKC